MTKLLASATLPRTGSDPASADCPTGWCSFLSVCVSPQMRARLEQLGTIIADTPAEDDCTVRVTLPKGWNIEPTDVEDHFVVMDANGKVVVTYFHHQGGGVHFEC